MVKKRRLIVLMTVALMIFSFKAFGYTGLLDTYAATGLTNAGLWSIDTWSINDKDFYVQNRITSSIRWGGGANAQVKIKIYKKEWYGWDYQFSKYFTKAPNDTSITTRSCTGLDPDEYRFYILSDYPDTINTNGYIYDDK